MPEAGPGRPILSVIIPALNEAENLRSLLPALQETLAGLGVRSEVLVADGGSSDTAPGLFREMVRVLAPGGVLILGTPDYSRWIWRVIERVYGWVLLGA
jgi:cellulose synthase/poly-beta-1,6-N-acetylglucosamine synthase-like glycosyltransferase